MTVKRPHRCLRDELSCRRTGSGLHVAPAGWARCEGRNLGGAWQTDWEAVTQSPL